MSVQRFSHAMGAGLSDYDAGVNVLRDFYSVAGDFYTSQGVSFPQLVAYYDSQVPSFIPNLGSSGKLLTETKIASAMKALGASAVEQASADPSAIYFPKYTSFFDALAGEALKFTMEDASAVIKSSALIAADTTTSALKIGAGVYAAVAAVGVVLALLIFTSQAKSVLRRNPRKRVYHVIGSHPDSPDDEVIDEFDTLKEAKEMLEEYKLEYGKGWTLYITPLWEEVKDE